MRLQPEAAGMSRPALVRTRGGMPRHRASVGGASGTSSMARMSSGEKAPAALELFTLVPQGCWDDAGIGGVAADLGAPCRAGRRGRRTARHRPCRRSRTRGADIGREACGVRGEVGVGILREHVGHPGGELPRHRRVGSSRSLKGPKISGMPPTFVVDDRDPGARSLEHDIGQGLGPRGDDEDLAALESLPGRHGAAEVTWSARPSRRAMFDQSLPVRPRADQQCAWIGPAQPGVSDDRGSAASSVSIALRGPQFADIDDVGRIGPLVRRGRTRNRRCRCGQCAGAASGRRRAAGTGPPRSCSRTEAGRSVAPSARSARMNAQLVLLPGLKFRLPPCGV